MTDAPKQMSAAEMRAERDRLVNNAVRADSYAEEASLGDFLALTLISALSRHQASNLTRRLEEMEKTR